MGVTEPVKPDRAAGSKNLAPHQRRAIPHTCGVSSMRRPIHVIASEAKQSMPRLGGMDCFVTFAPRNDGGYSFAVSRRIAPEVCMNLFPPFENRGSRECRVLAAPAVSCAIVRRNAHTSIQVQPEHSGIPCAMV